MESVHEGKKPHKCEVCPKGFASKNDLRRDLLAAHERKKLYKCQLCDKKFSI